MGKEMKEDLGILMNLEYFEEKLFETNNKDKKFQVCYVITKKDFNRIIEENIEMKKKLEDLNK